uniref:Uncharacterized protein n=1 Tax=Panagrolaimus sp. ES5 TaxID=591445 RepID=A0AC34FVY7_9BILA
MGFVPLSLWIFVALGTVSNGILVENGRSSILPPNNNNNFQNTNNLIPQSATRAATANSHIHDNQRGSVNPLTTSQIVFLNTVSNVQQPGVATNRNIYGMPGYQTPRITAQMLREIDWTQIDRRAEDGWWHLYPFGERFFDKELSHRPWMDKQIDLDFFFPYYGFRFNYTF